MANRFGYTYNLDSYIKFQRAQMGNTRIHTEIYQQARDKKGKIAKKNVVKQERQKKRDFVNAGSGHRNISTFLSPNATCSSSKRHMPVTDDTNHKKRCSRQLESHFENTGEQEQGQNEPDDSYYDDAELNEMISMDHEQDDEKELKRQEIAAGLTDANEEEVELVATDANEEEVELVAVSYPKDTLDSAILRSIVGTSCRTCGNDKDDCHNTMFGQFLIHEVLTSLQDMVPDDADETWIKDTFTQKYRLVFRFHCYHMYGKYDEKQDYDLPECVVNGSMDFARTLVKHQTVIYHIRWKREHGIGNQFFGRCALVKEE